MDPNSSVNVAVIIPFFQRERGVLQRALRSVAAQTLMPTIAMTVFLVDDGSPVPVSEEVEAFDIPAPHQLVILKQQNTGPGGARNCALDNIDPAHFDFVAFLDSDDEWLPCHLSQALISLGDEFDFYFCDHTRFDTKQSWFDDLDVTTAWKNSRETYLRQLDDRDSVFIVDPDDLFLGLLKEYLSQTSTVVFRFPNHSGLRFDTELRNAGEDHLFWLSLASSSCAVISFDSNVYCGKGVNIYYSAFDWNLKSSVDRYGYLVLFYLKIRSKFPLNAAGQSINNDNIRIFSRTYSYLFFRLFFKGKFPNISVTKTILHKSIYIVLLMPLNFIISAISGLDKRRSW
ncbi:glycosyltransferase family 2 protein [Mesorhizobium sp. NZP2077]|uniref:glycosyltransferase family A protein n=1 Tax=Mesorhizobium sp. NZP2077 TaxID=2483404 RepID=UPI001553BA3D|nr:glycosyltransferase family 2 protein [Mesorhizobium sp. NZP2077]QKC80443.1 glycosyltransferase family 2 protein [Mesorhizobium sp. NZP2077]QKD13822.1 glycosyltransferase family 2 protein [Mesorhizobium sp. NZP2077]